jgi:glycosyltransferase involved in cell wall biosynthesis
METLLETNQTPTPIDLSARQEDRRFSGLLVSVIVPLYNGAVHIRDALHSILRQSYTHLEIIVVDDGSQDAGPAIIQSMSDGRIRYVRQDNAGTASARNHGVRLSRGRYLAFLDQDDLWLPNKLSAQMAAFAQDSSLDLLFGHVWQTALPPESLPANALFHEGLRLPGFLPSTMIASREAFWQVGEYSEQHTLAESFDWFVRAREKRLRQLLLDEILVIRRIHQANKGIEHRHARPEYAQVLKAAIDRRRAQEHATAFSSTNLR